MPLSSYPVLPNYQRNLIVQIQCHHGRASASSAPYHTRAISAPEKVAMPLLFPRVEELNSSSSQWIVCMRLYAFRVIAETAREPKVVLIIRSTSHSRQNMFDFKHLHRIALWGKAVTTTIAGRD